MIMHAPCFTGMAQYKNLGSISRSLNAMLTVIIGPEVFINIRRITTNLRDDIYRIQFELEKPDYVPCYSGSRAEGLRFESSDDDWMLIHRKIKVIPSVSDRAKYDSNTTLLLMENEMTKPGFTLLKLLGESTARDVLRSTEYILNGRYLSCKYWRELHTVYRFLEFTHGPCASAKTGLYEYDIAYSLRCDIWPTNAQDCIRRLQQSPWPSHDTVLSIVNDGVLFVPIGAKKSIFENTEWRMSFSLAEKKLIHVMNHTQFLSYGLLKLFLKEAIDVNPDVKGLLCSYFLKTALFWEITTTSHQWNPSTLLSCFWNCFRRLLQWVRCSYCPNFFIPQNNMFEGKLEGRNQERLLRHLIILYYEGYTSLLRCHSLVNKFSSIVHRNMKLSPVPSEALFVAHQIIMECYQRVVLQHCIPRTGFQSILMYLFANVTSSHEGFLLKNWLHQYLIHYSLSHPDSSVASGCNRSHYSDFTKRMNIMGRSRTDSVAFLLYKAMLCYNNVRYTRALRLVQKSKEKISDPCSIQCHDAKEHKFRKVGLDHLPIETVLKRHFLEQIVIDNDKHIPELYFERRVSCIQTKGRVIIPPLVFAFFLQYLCQRKLGHLREADDVLYELSLLVQHDDRHHIDIRFLALSWQILGICQQMSGDDRTACRSFMAAQRQFDKDSFKFATCIRIGIILVRYF